MGGFVWAQPSCWQNCIWNKLCLQLFALEPCLKPQEAAQPSSKMVTLKPQGGAAGRESDCFFGNLPVDGLFGSFFLGCFSCYLVAEVGRRLSSPHWINVYVIFCFQLGNWPPCLWKSSMFTKTIMARTVTEYFQMEGAVSVSLFVCVTPKYGPWFCMAECCFWA